MGGQLHPLAVLFFSEVIMHQWKKPVVDVNDHTNQFNYLGRWVDKESFCAFVYDKNGQSKLAKNYDEYEDLTTSGVWFESQISASIANQKGKQKDGTIRADS